MARRLVNEKTLELNITHELMFRLGVGVFGFTQQEEARIGADVFFPCIRPFIIQYKAPKGGEDYRQYRWARFFINNNKRKNQHLALHAIASSGFDAYYAFPLVLSNPYLVSHFGDLLSDTIFVFASNLTGTLNWRNQIHRVDVWNNGQFVVYSPSSVEGKGISAKQFLDKIHDEIVREPYEETILTEFVVEIIQELENIVKKAEIVGRSEHTLIIVGIDAKTGNIGYFQLPIQIRGLPDRKHQYSPKSRWELP